MALPKLFGRILPKISISQTQKLQIFLSSKPIQNFNYQFHRQYADEKKEPPQKAEESKKPEVFECIKKEKPVEPEPITCLLTCKIAIVTGAMSGIGLEASRELLQNGARAVILVDIKEDKDALCCLRKTYGEDKVFFYKADVARKDEFEKVFAATKAKFRRLDIVINSAGMLADGEWERTVCVNMYGLVLGTYLGISYMGTHNCCGRGGTIINISSLLGGIVPMHCSPVYAGSKHFVLGFQRSIGHEFYKQTDVRMMGILPGFTVTDLSDPKKMALRTGYKDFGNNAEEYKQGTKSLPKQNPEAVACCMINMLRTGSHGDLFTVEKCVCTKICIPDWRTLRTPPAPPPKPALPPRPVCEPKPPLKEDCKVPVPEPKGPCQKPRVSPCDKKPPPPPPKVCKPPPPPPPPPPPCKPKKKDCCCIKKKPDPCNPPPKCCCKPTKPDPCCEDECEKKKEKKDDKDKDKKKK